jgi:NitT/TauT family transport system ATP-binding protein
MGDVSKDGIALRNVGLSYRRRGREPLEALRGTDLEIRDGELFAVVGPTGCGKSSLLLVISGILEPTEGEIVIRGGPVAEAKARAEFGFIFQDAVLLPWRTALGNVRLPLEVTGYDAARREARCRELLAWVHLERFAEAMPHELSGGMKQRVAIVRALAHNPSILLMDEPFAALDEITKRRLHLDFLEVWEREHKTAILITHDLYEAIFLADRVAVMTPSPGQIKRVVDVDLARPRTLDMRDSEAFVRQARAVRELLEG